MGFLNGHARIITEPKYNYISILPGVPKKVLHLINNGTKVFCLIFILFMF